MKGTYTGENPTKLSKIDIALLQLEDAISLFIEGRYISSITLAGAADGVFCGLMVTQGGESPGDLTWKQIEDFRRKGIQVGGIIDRKEAFRLWNATRNILKHHNSDDFAEVELHPEDEAYDWVERANLSANFLECSPKNYNDFKNHTIPRYFLDK